MLAASRSPLAFVFVALAFLAATCLGSPTVAGLADRNGVSKRDFGPVTIYTPPSNYQRERSLYARHVMLNDSIGTILATWENYSPAGSPPWFPIYRSTDHGYTWSQLSTVRDTVNGWGLRYQPELYQLKNAVGSWPKGTVLCAGNSIPDDLSQTKLDIYASKDAGATWTFVSSVARGGRAYPDNGETPVWEPFFMEYNGQLVMYYSDQRDSAYGQKIVHQVSSDLRNWGSVVNDVAVSPYSARPGMPTIAKLPNGQYIMTYEYGGASEANFAIYYKLSSNPLNFGSASGRVLRTTDGAVFTSSPYVVWTPAGSASGTSNGAIVVSAMSSTDLFVNRALGDPSKWTRLSAPGTAGAYSRSLSVGFLPKDIVITDGGYLNAGSSNKVTFAARDVNGCNTC
ncbi:glycoside hydrolase family 93 protein [Tilletiopsis washingtonensis]|jgi:hypothetical protein|uniref:Glycoside hydrolase family 93 protein n=1 Tax=Tilletiopsis washingtonensis TaxID=58919 RepID=A0A316YZV6_9BASI|nr:glycoside hydrolase family 93 protein [Tilletiopsis washingtonensis]PWN94987.1 glycoside hydrolase family 93 protein [Tilletiopsis washingtonensis]